jgi:hypothetical protein
MTLALLRGLSLYAQPAYQEIYVLPSARWLWEPALLRMYDEILPQIDRALDESLARKP